MHFPFQKLPTRNAARDTPALSAIWSAGESLRKRKRKSKKKCKRKRERKWATESRSKGKIQNLENK